MLRVAKDYVYIKDLSKVFKIKISKEKAYNGSFETLIDIIIWNKLIYKSNFQGTKNWPSVHSLSMDLVSNIKLQVGNISVG